MGVQVQLSIGASRRACENSSNLISLIWFIVSFFWECWRQGNELNFWVLVKMGERERGLGGLSNFWREWEGEQKRVIRRGERERGGWVIWMWHWGGERGLEEWWIYVASILMGIVMTPVIIFINLVSIVIAPSQFVSQILNQLEFWQAGQKCVKCPILS